MKTMTFNQVISWQAFPEWVDYILVHRFNKNQYIFARGKSTSITKIFVDESGNAINSALWTEYSKPSRSVLRS